MEKQRYRLRNWSESNKALVKRGSLTVWFDEDSLTKWHVAQASGKKGRPFFYSQVAIECALTLRTLFRLPLRATQGLVASLIELLDLAIICPDYTTLCRRQSTLQLKVSSSSLNKENQHILIDSSGIKIYGEGEWKVKMHGKTKRRTWRKLHIAIDANTQEIIIAKTTLANVHDSQVLPDLISPIDSCLKISADGAYDTHACYEAALKKQAKPNFPPRMNASLNKPTDEAWRLRNHVIMQVRYKGLKSWKKETKYHRRSLAETAFSRLKKLFGHHANNKKFTHQSTELLLRCKLLNRMSQLGMPESVKIPGI